MPSGCVNGGRFSRPFFPSFLFLLGCFVHIEDFLRGELLPLIARVIDAVQ